MYYVLSSLRVGLIPDSRFEYKMNRQIVDLQLFGGFLFCFCQPNVPKVVVSIGAFCFSLYIGIPLMLAILM